MWRNWASRSGCGGPSRVLRLACKLYPAAVKSSRTSWWLTRWPMLCRARARVRVLFAVQRRGESGAPEVVGSTSPSRSRSSVGSLSIVRFRPPPGRRTRPGGQPHARPQFAEPAGDRRRRNARGPRHQGHAAPAEGARLGRGPHAARPLGQRRRQRPVLRSTIPEVHSFDSTLRSLTLHHLLSYDDLVRGSTRRWTGRR